MSSGSVKEMLVRKRSELNRQPNKTESHHGHARFNKLCMVTAGGQQKD